MTNWERQAAIRSSFFGRCGSMYTLKLGSCILAPRSGIKLWCGFIERGPCRRERLHLLATKVVDGNLLFEKTEDGSHLVERLTKMAYVSDTYQQGKIWRRWCRWWMRGGMLPMTYWCLSVEIMRSFQWRPIKQMGQTFDLSSSMIGQGRVRWRDNIPEGVVFSEDAAYIVSPQVSSFGCSDKRRCS